MNSSQTAVAVRTDYVRRFEDVPIVGERSAELIEMPLMLSAIVCVAKKLFGTHPAGWPARSRVGSGIVATALLLVAERGIVFFVRGQSPAEYVQARELVAGIAYLLMLVAFARMPGAIPHFYLRKRKQRRMPPFHGHA